MKAGKNSTSIRQENLSLVLGAILGAKEGPSRAKLATQTGLTRATVSRLVDELINARLIDELDPVRPAVGRPAAPLVAREYQHVIMAAEINLEYVAIYALDVTGAALGEEIIRMDSRRSDPKKVLSRVGELVAKAAGELPMYSNLLETVLCVPGLISADSHTIITAPNLGWSNVDALPYFDFPDFDPARFRVMNEADAAAYSVLYDDPGARAGVDNFLYISAEVGVGAAIVFDGQLFAGDHGWAGEIGHMCVDRSGPKCRCGSNGCLEQYAGADSIIRNAGYRLDIPLERIAELFDAGDSGARASIDACATALGTAIANVLNLLDLELVVLGGNFGRLYDRLEVIMNAEIEYRVLGRRWENVEVTTSTYGDSASARGACLAGFARIFANPEIWNERGIPISFD